MATELSSIELFIPTAGVLRLVWALEIEVDVAAVAPTPSLPREAAVTGGCNCEVAVESGETAATSVIGALSWNRATARMWSAGDHPVAHVG